MGRGDRGRFRHHVFFDETASRVEMDSTVSRLGRCAWPANAPGVVKDFGTRFQASGFNPSA
jgi:hypothetical protein